MPSRASLASGAPASITKPADPPKRELHALAEVAYHYLRCGGFPIARAIFEGLAAIDAEEPYFAQALGLAADHLGEREAAARWYQRARELDPKDGRSDINLAELILHAGDRARARALLRSGAEKARACGDRRLERKALALLELSEGCSGARGPGSLSGRKGGEPCVLGSVR